MEQNQAGSLPDLSIPTMPTFHTDKSILKGELVWTIMEIRVIWVVV